MTPDRFVAVLLAVLVIAMATYAQHLEDRLDAERRARRVEHELARIFQQQARRERAKNDGDCEVADAIEQAEEWVNQQ